MSTEIKQIIGLAESSSLAAVQASPAAFQASLVATTSKGVMKRKKLETFIAHVASGSETEDEPPKIPKIYMRIQRKKPEEGKLEKTKVTPLATHKQPLKERKPIEKRNLIKETAPTLGKKKKSNLDMALECNKSVKVIPPLSIDELVEQITKDGILSNIQYYYEHMDDIEQKEIEEAVLLYFDI